MIAAPTALLLALSLAASDQRATALILTRAHDTLTQRFSKAIDQKFDQNTICDDDCVTAELLRVRPVGRDVFDYEIRVQRIGYSASTKITVHRIRGRCVKAELDECSARVSTEIARVGPTLALSRSVMPKVKVINVR